MECVTTVSMQILWNGECTAPFKPTRGIRQGDPLSPYLFVLCMERLNQIIEEAIIGGRWRPIHASRGGPKLSNLFFADDIILFAEASCEQAGVIRECLDRFCRASGQKVSLQKSTVYFSHNVSLLEQRQISEHLGMSATDDMGIYLGMPTLTSRVTRQTYAHLCEKIDRRLTGWKSKYLSLAGRITLAKSTLSTIANYSMQTAKIPRTTCDAIDKKIRRFVWGADEHRNRIHLISWDTLQKPKNEGGMGFRSARQANSAFLTKLGWRLLAEPNALWSRVLRHKYCKGRCDTDMFIPSSNMSNVWRGITENATWVQKGSSMAVGNGKETRFWDHRWATEVPLRSLALNPIPEAMSNALVEEMWIVGQGWHWDKFANLLPSSALMHIAGRKLIEDPNVADLRYWRGSKNGGFSIKYALTLMREDGGATPDPKWNFIWSTPVQQRIRTFMWLVLHNRLLCNANRVKRKLSEDPRCLRCPAQDEETILHLLRDCPIARVVWRNVGGATQDPSFWMGSLEDWMVCNLQAQGRHFSDTWPTCFAVVVWWLWRWRNLVVFGRQQDIPVDTGSFLQNRFTEAWQAFYGEGNSSLQSLLQHQGRQEVYIRWQAPPIGWFTINTDGAAKGSPGPSGGGGVLRDNRGMFLRGFAANFGMGSAFKAELLAAEIGLEMAVQLGIQKIILQMDNKACLEGLKNPDYHGGEHFHVLNNCRNLINSFGCNISLLHCFREGNKVADSLANMGVELGVRVVFFETPPMPITYLLREDIVGVATPRLIPRRM